MKVLGMTVSNCWNHPSILAFEENETVTKISILGIGSFSKVYEVKRSLDSGVYALKLARGEVDCELLKHESSMIHFLNEKEDEEGVDYIVRFLATFILKNKVALLESLYQGDLKVLVESEKGLSMKKTLEIMACFFEILSFMEKHGVIHRDIKPDNVFITERGEIKLGDFGMAIFKKDCPVSNKAGTHGFISPEYYIKNSLCDYASDMWSAAALFCFVYLGDKRMFDGETVGNILLNYQIRLRKPYSENPAKHILPGLRRLILWEPKETSQATFEDVMLESFLSKKKEEASLEAIIVNPSVERKAARCLSEIKDLVEFNKFSSFLKELFEFDPDKRSSPEKALNEFERVFGSKQKLA